MVGYLARFSWPVFGLPKYTFGSLSLQASISLLQASRPQAFTLPSSSKTASNALLNSKIAIVHTSFWNGKQLHSYIITLVSVYAIIFYVCNLLSNSSKMFLPHNISENTNVNTAIELAITVNNGSVIILSENTNIPNGITLSTNIIN